MHEVVDIPWSRLFAAFALLLVLFAADRWARFNLTKPLGIAVARGVVQLLAIGYVLTAIFAIDNPFLVLGLLLIMLSVAAHASTQRLKKRSLKLARLLGLSLGAGTVCSLIVMSQWVVQTKPWYDPQYLIPFGGMLLGNSMNATSLAGERFQEELKTRVREIETKLALGFSARETLHPLFARSLRASLIPILNSLSVAGVVQLPGMMTGQILSGTDPVLAVKYQILIYVLILFSTTVSASLFLLLIRRRYVTSAQQLRRELL